jgi:antitoxin component of RelBE/YafQ-DinJ toxin-antitoxin module
MEFGMAVTLLKEKNVVKAKVKPPLKITNAETLRAIREVEAGVDIKYYNSVDDFFKEFHKNEAH